MSSDTSDRTPALTRQELSRIIDSARSIMRKDKGLSGELDRIPMLTWLLFLKFLDDMEVVREYEAALNDGVYRPICEPPYRWRDWAVGDHAMTGDELIAFINHEEARRSDGEVGAGLLTYLRGLSGTETDRRADVVANVFAGTTNRMINGYLLRDVVDKVNEFDFASSDEAHTLGHLYESLLREMRDVAGDSGEFYTPRPVVNFMVEVVNPKLGESILDPAAGTGGFLVEAFRHLERQARSVEDYERLQRASIFGGEPKPLPYLLCQMNLLLHGLESPVVDPLNSLRFPLREIGDRDRVDIVLTNPPFGGEEERSIRANFPPDLQTSETALLFLQLIMRRLRRRPRPGRAGVVVPNTTLFRPGVAAKLRRLLLTDFNLTTVVRLPKGVFEPYTDIETNLLFFEAGAPSDEILFYRLDPPEDRKQYTKTQPLRAEDLAESLHLIQKRSAESPKAWFARAADLLEGPECNLDLHNPKEVRESGELPAVVYAKLDQALSDSQARLAETGALIARLEMITAQRNAWAEVELASVLTRRREVVEIESGETYKRLRIQVKGRGVVLRDELDGAQIGTKRQFRVASGQFVLSKIDARNGAFGVVPEECDGAIITGNFWAYDVDDRVLRPRLLHLLTRSDAFLDFCRRASPGATNRRYLQEPKFLEQVAFVPIDPAVQDELCDVLEDLGTIARFGEHTLPQLGKQFPFILQSSLDQVFGLETTDFEPVSAQDWPERASEAQQDSNGGKSAGASPFRG